MRVTHLSTHDLTGGAALSAYRLHSSLRALGHNSTLIALYKLSSDPSVILLNPRRSIAARIRRKLRLLSLARTQQLLASRPVHSTYFSDDRSRFGADVFRQLPPVDVLHIHWIAELFDCSAFFRRLPERVPLVWTLHDMNVFTGGCHHTGDCLGFTNNCGRCPQLNSETQNDISRSSWKRKHKAYSHLWSRPFAVVTPSRWLASEVGRSSLMSSYPRHVIPYGVDTSKFCPSDRAAARKALGIHQNAKVILFVSRWLHDGFKGLPLLLDIVRSSKLPNVFFLLIGEGGLPGELSSNGLALGVASDHATLHSAYTAADLLALPSLHENFPNVALEALSCGLPIVASNTGGIPEIVRDGVTGSLFQKGDPEALASALRHLLACPDRRLQMSRECRRIAVQEYDLQVQARRYENLYSELTAQAAP